MTSELSAQAAAAAVERIHAADAAQATRAAERRAAGAYGVCEDCGEAIGRDRLEFLPDSTRCVRCQSKHDGS